MASPWQPPRPSVRSDTGGYLYFSDKLGLLDPTALTCLGATMKVPSGIERELGYA